MHLSRLAEEMVIWSSADFAFIKMSDAFSVCAAINQALTKGRNDFIDDSVALLSIYATQIRQYS